MKSKILYSATLDPWFNLAIEDWIFNDINPDSHLLYLWRNSDTVVIGRYQNPWNECRLDVMEKDGVKLARRQSGGGAVYHDSKNLNFTFMSGIDDYSKERNFEIIIAALAKFGIKAEVSGRNDILVDGKKISGSAFKLRKDRAFHHGTLLVDVDLERLSGYLNPDTEKLTSKGIKSVKSRVANLKTYNNDINTDVLSDRISETFIESFGPCEREVLDFEVIKENRKLVSYYELMKSWEWLYQRSPDFNYKLEKRFEWGSIEINMDISNAQILDIVIFTDCLFPEMIEMLIENLKGKKFIKKSFEETVDMLTVFNPSWTLFLDDILKIITENSFL